MKLFIKTAWLIMVAIAMLMCAKIPAYAADPTILGPEITKYITSRSDTVSVGVYDTYTGKTYTYNPSKTYQTASIVKVSMLADVLYQRKPITSYENSLLTRMIENSDNSAASTIWQQLGSDKYVQYFYHTAGMNNTIAGQGGWWGYTTTNVLDQLTLMKYFAFSNKFLTDDQRAYGLNLMQNVEADQRWGVSYGVPSSGVKIALKNGWSNSNQPNNWRINSIGYINGQGKNYVIAVLTINNKTESYGIETINNISKMVWNEMPQHSQYFLPRGYIDAPTKNASIKGQSLVRGWFLDTTGVSKVEVLVDGKVKGTAQYGLARPDVEKSFPVYQNANSGYQYSLNTLALTDGQHTLTVKETGKNGNITSINQTVNVQNLPARGSIDTPRNKSAIKGQSAVQGWFLDVRGVSKVEVLVDGKTMGTAQYGLARPDVAKVYPDYQNSNSGYQFTLNTLHLANGQHTLAVKETSKYNTSKTISYSITIKN